ncbi:MAG TPA: SDR family oxidoreductase [Stellaceae bacterium]|jgi:3-oxoacyl-[acyl-carrier protein] reductase
MVDRFIGKVALITGGTSGIGAASARRIAREGGAVAIVGRNAEAGAAIVADIGAEGGRAIFVQLDVRDRAGIQEAVDQVVERLSRIDVLVNSAGIAKLAPFLDTPPDMFQDTFDVNVGGTFFFGQAVARAMIKHDVGGSIVNVASISGQRGSTRRAAYGLSKSAVIHLTKVMAAELAQHRIRVNAVSPGPITTPLSTAVHKSATVAAYRALTPAGRFAELEEVAAAVVFLASDEASYITGHTLNVDGGFCAAGLID